MYCLYYVEATPYWQIMHADASKWVQILIDNYRYGMMTTSKC